MLAFSARESTRDVDTAILAPREARIVRELARQVAVERDWPEDWLNDGVPGEQLKAQYAFEDLWETLYGSRNS